MTADPHPNSPASRDTPASPTFKRERLLEPYQCPYKTYGRQNRLSDLQRIINEPTHVVAHLMQGLALDAARLTLLDLSTDHDVAVRAALDKNPHVARVSVVSGGGRGHEAMASGYVGTGVLAAAV